MFLVCCDYSYYHRRVYDLINLDYGSIPDHGLSYSLGYSLSLDYNNINSL